MIDWASLSERCAVSNQIVVDVGGGFGHTSRLVQRAYPNLRFVVQDRDSVVNAATMVHNPSCLMLSPLISVSFGKVKKRNRFWIRFRLKVRPADRFLSKPS